MGVINDLVGHGNDTRTAIVANPAHGSHRDDFAGAGFLQRPDIGPIIDGVRHQRMAVTVPGQKHQRQAIQFADRQRA